MHNQERDGEREYELAGHLCLEKLGERRGGMPLIQGKGAEAPAARETVVVVLWCDSPVSKIVYSSLSLAYSITYLL